jgi:hypothetical protein
MDDKGKVCAEDLTRIKRAMERTPTLFRLLSTLRTRRVGTGYSIESGNSETHGITMRNLCSKKGPLNFSSTAEPEPLTELETALLCWAACGPSGIVAGDIGVTNDLGTLMGFAGRTIASASNDWSVDLIFTNDEGTFLYRPTQTRSKVVEIDSESDYPKILQWFREGVIQLSDKRLDLDWSVSPGRPMGVWQYNLNKPGSTWFLPVADMAKGALNLYFSVFEHMQWLITDEETTQSCGLDAWAKPGFLEFPITQRQYEEVMMHAADYQHGMLIQNLRLAAEAMGLGCWIFGGFCPDLVLGGFRNMARGLNFTHEVIRGKRNYVGIPGLLEGFGLPSPWCQSVDELVHRVLQMKRESTMELPYLPKVESDVRHMLGRRYSEWCLKAVKSVLTYLYDRYGRFPVYYSAINSNLHAQIHHVDTRFYETYLNDGYITALHKRHFADWHASSTDGPSEAS